MQIDSIELDYSKEQRLLERQIFPKQENWKNLESWMPLP